MIVVAQVLVFVSLAVWAMVLELNGHNPADQLFLLTVWLLYLGVAWFSRCD